MNREGLGQQPYLPVARERLESRYYGDIDSRRAAFVAEVVEDLVVEEHLGHYIVGPGVHLALQHLDVVLEVGSLEMLLGIGAYPYAEETVASELLVLEAVYGAH